MLSHMSQIEITANKIEKLKTYTADARMEKRNQIRERAKDMLSQVGWNDFSMDALAKASGVAKGTLYIYFQTKEDVFVAVYLNELKNWAEKLCAAKLNLRTQAEKVDLIEPMANLFAESFSGFNLMMDLSAGISASFYRNLSSSTRLELQSTEQVTLEQVALRLNRAFPKLQQHQACELVRAMLIAKDAAWTSRQRMLSANVFSHQEIVEQEVFESDLLRITRALLVQDLTTG